MSTDPNEKKNISDIYKELQAHIKGKPRNLRFRAFHEFWWRWRELNKNPK